MSDFKSSVTGSPFNTFKANNLIHKTVNQTKVSTTSTPVEPPKQEISEVTNKDVSQYLKNKIKNAMPYIATGTSVLAIGASIVAYNKTSKNTKAMLNQLTQINNKLATTVESAPKKETVKGLTSFMMGLIGAGTGVAAAGHFDDHKNTLIAAGMSEDEINKARDNAKSTIDNRNNSVNNANNVANEAREKANKVQDGLNDAISKTYEALNTAKAASNKDSLAMAIHTKPHYGLNLLVVNNNDKYVNTKKLASALQDINTAVVYRNNRKPGDTDNIIAAYKEKYVPLMGSNSTWSITAEYDPIKAGGLGSVPMEIHNNWSDMGIDNPVFIPMYQFKGKSEFKETTNNEGKTEYKYIYDNQEFKLEKMAEMPVTQYRGNKAINQNVEFYLGHANRKDGPNPDQPIVFVKNSNNFGGDIYANGFNADEPEKFAFLSKAVYQLAEAKVADALGESKTGLGELKIVNKEAYDAVKAPVGMMLNDWHAAPMAGLLRYKAPMENAYNGISDKVKDALRDMPLEMVGHNAGIPGSTRGHSSERSDMVTENIINTLYDGYATGIVENAHTGRGPESVCNAILWERNDDNNRQFNNLAHGIALSDVYVPVSKNYEKELKDNVQSAGLAFDAIQGKKDSGDVRGVINGLDRNTSSTIAKAGWLNSKFGMETAVYNHNTPIDKIMEARQHNKEQLFDKYVDKIQKGATSLGGYNFNVVTSPSNVSKEDFMKAPVFAFAHRLTDQKGLVLYKNAVIEMFNTWDEKHPGQPKPFIIAGGQLEDKNQQQYLYDLKNADYYKNKDDANRVLSLEGFMPNPALMAGVTYFVAPSTFEPCGLTQGECYAMGTPIVTTATGGFVDTIKDGKNGFVAPYTSLHSASQNGKSYGDWENESSHSLAEKFNEAVDTYFNKPDTYKQFVENNINENLSWNRGEENDAIHQHMKVLGITSNDIIESHIAGVRKNVIIKSLKQLDNLVKNGNIKEEDIENAKQNNKLNRAIDKLSNSAKNNAEEINKFNKNIDNVKNNDKKREDLKQAEIETLTIAKNNVEGKKLYKDKALEILADDSRLLNEYAEKIIANKENLNTQSDEFKEINEWKNSLYKKYVA